MRGLRPSTPAWKVPTILTDASPQIELVRHLWLDMKLGGDIGTRPTGARRAGQCLGASLDRCRRWRLPPDDDDPRHLTETVDLRDDALLRDSKQDAGRGESGLTVQPGVHVAQRAPSPCALRLARPPDLLLPPRVRDRRSQDRWRGAMTARSCGR